MPGPRLKQRAPDGNVVIETLPGVDRVMSEDVARYMYPDLFAETQSSVAPTDPDTSVSLDERPTTGAALPYEENMVFPEDQVASTPSPALTPAPPSRTSVRAGASVSGPINEAAAARYQRRTGLRGIPGQLDEIRAAQEAGMAQEATGLGEQARLSAEHSAVQADRFAEEATKIAELHGGTARAKEIEAISSPEEYDAWVRENPEQAGSAALGRARGRDLGRDYVEARARYDERIQQARMMAETKVAIDPENAFADRSVLSKAMLIFAAYAGGRAGLQGDMNPGLAAINNIIERDIAAQEANERMRQNTIDHLKWVADTDWKADLTGLDRKDAEYASRFEALRIAAENMAMTSQAERNAEAARFAASLMEAEKNKLWGAMHQRAAESALKNVMAKAEVYDKQDRNALGWAQVRLAANAQRAESEAAKAKAAAEFFKSQVDPNTGIVVKLGGKVNPNSAIIYRDPGQAEKMRNAGGMLTDHAQKVADVRQFITELKGLGKLSNAANAAEAASRIYEAARSGLKFDGEKISRASDKDVEMLLVSMFGPAGEKESMLDVVKRKVMRKEFDMDRRLDEILANSKGEVSRAARAQGQGSAYLRVYGAGEGGAPVDLNIDVNEIGVDYDRMITQRDYTPEPTKSGKDIASELLLDLSGGAKKLSQPNTDFESGREASMPKAKLRRELIGDAARFSPALDAPSSGGKVDSIVHEAANLVKSGNRNEVNAYKERVYDIIGELGRKGLGTDDPVMQKLINTYEALQIPDRWPEFGSVLPPLGIKPPWESE